MRLFVIILMVFSLLSIIASIRIIQTEKYLADKIYPNVTINNIDFGNKPKTEVVSYFEGLNRNFKKSRLTILEDETPIATYPADLLDIGYDSQGIADRAYLIGRSSHFPSRLYQKLATVLNWQKFKFTTRLKYD